MDKAEAEKIANDMLSRYALSEQERQVMQGFTGVLMVYGTPDYGVSKKAAEGVLKQIQEQPEKAAIRGDDGNMYVLKRAWMEGTEEAGRVFAEYVRAE
jgi:hypothetical protein